MVCRFPKPKPDEEAVMSERTKAKVDALLRMSAVVENAPYLIEDVTKDKCEVSPKATLCGSSSNSGSGSSALGRSAKTAAKTQQ
jgi:hypothetical protein